MHFTLFMHPKVSFNMQKKSNERQNLLALLLFALARFFVVVADTANCKFP